MIYRIPLFIAVLFLALAAGPEPAHAIALDKCVRVLHDPRVNRETLLNTCRECRVVKIERRRPGSGGTPPSTRTYTLPGGAKQPLPFLGPGKTRILTELSCPRAQ